MGFALCVTHMCISPLALGMCPSAENHARNCLVNWILRISTNIRPPISRAVKEHFGFIRCYSNVSQSLAHIKSPGGLGKTRLLDHTPELLIKSVSGGRRICISDKLPAGTEASSSGITLGDFFQACPLLGSPAEAGSYFSVHKGIWSGCMGECKCHLSVLLNASMAACTRLLPGAEADICTAVREQARQLPLWARWDWGPWASCSHQQGINKQAQFLLPFFSIV